jgi:hypothetical protein
MWVGVSHVAAPPEAEHTTVRGSARQLAPARPLVLESVHGSLTGPRAGSSHDRLGQPIDGQVGARQGVADGRDDPVGLLRSESDRLGMHGNRRWQSR